MHAEQYSSAWIRAMTVRINAIAGADFALLTDVAGWPDLLDHIHAVRAAT